MPARRRILRIVLLIGIAIVTILFGAVGYAWWEINRVADSNINAKMFTATAGELQEFVEATGRWPETEEEFIQRDGGYFDPSQRKEAASRTIIVYDVDLAKEDLESVESFRLLKPKDPRRFTDYVFVELSVEELLTILRAARDGEIPPASPVDRAAPESKSDQADLKKLSIDELVERLASPEPAPDGDPRPGEQVHPQVAAASEELVARGRPVVLALLKRRDDPRYSWSEVWSRRLDLSVGDRVMRIVEEILEPEVHVEERMGVIKSYPRFTNYLREVGIERYLDRSENASDQQRELAFLRWYVREVDEEYRERAPFDLPEHGAWLDAHLVPFRTRIVELEAAGVATASPLD